MSVFQNINVIQYHVTDWERAKAFYTEVLGWPVAFASDEIGWIEFGAEGAAHLALNRWDQPESLPPGGGVIVVLSVESCAAAYAELQAKGVRCDPVVSIPGVVNYGTFYDPDGNKLQYAGGE